MIITLLFKFILILLGFISEFGIPPLPDDVYDYVSSAFGYIASGVGIVANYVPLSYLALLFSIVLVIDFAMVTYKLIMWILRKIPVLGIS